MLSGGIQSRNLKLFTNLKRKHKHWFKPKPTITQNLCCAKFKIMEDFIWNTSHYHPDNTFTMNEYLEEHLPDEFECFFQDGSYAEVQCKTSGKIYGLHAGGNGDSFNHRVRFEFIR